MMGMLKSAAKAVEDGANTAVNVGKAAAAGVAGAVKAAADGSKVTIRLKQPHLTSGDVLEGWVDVDARIPLLAKGIDLRITGYEKTEWHDRSERIAEGAAPGQPQVGIPVFTRNRGKKTLFDTKIRVHEMNNSMLPAGVHSFPFKWQLPAALPGSFYERVPLKDIPTSAEFKDRDLVADWNDSDDEDANGRASVMGAVRYKIKAVFDVVDALWMKDMLGQSALIVRPRTEATGPLHAEAAQDVMGCCSKAGTVTVSARFDKASYTVGETADVRADVHNDCPKPVKTSVCLQRTLTLRGQGGVERKVMDNNFQPQLLFQEFAAKAKTSDCRMPLLLNGPQCRPTTAGSLVSCSFQYLLKVGPTTVSMPVTLHQPDAQAVAQPGSPMSPNAGAVAPMH